MHTDSTIYRLTTLGLVGLLLTAFITIALPQIGNAQAAPPPTPPGATLEQRVAQRKAERATTLAALDQKRLVNTCTNAQSKIRGTQQTLIQSLTKRTQIYLQIDGRVLVMVGKLKQAQKDTFELEKQRSELVAKAASVTTVGQAYKQTLDDLVVINCKADPVAFKAMLETARSYNLELRTQSAATKAHIIDKIKPTLSGFATELQGASSTGQAAQ